MSTCQSDLDRTYICIISSLIALNSGGVGPSLSLWLAPVVGNTSLLICGHWPNTNSPTFDAICRRWPYVGHTQLHTNNRFEAWD